MMNDDMLSQEEIDALLRSTDDEEPEQETKESTVQNPPVDDYLNSVEQDALGEIGNISFGSSATTLSTLLNQKVEITTPTISVIHRENLQDEFPQPYVGVEVEYTEGFSGVNLFVIQSRDAAIIADLMLGGDGQAPSEELNDIHLSAVQEAMNQMMGTAATSMSTVFTKRVDISPPAISVLDVEADQGTKPIDSENNLVKVSFQLQIGDLIDSNIMQLLPVNFAKDLVDQLLHPSDSEENKQETEPPLQEQNVAKPEQAQQPTAENADSRARTEYNREPASKNQQPNHIGGKVPSKAADVQQAEFSSFEQVDLPAKEQRNLDILMDIPLKVTVELGRTKRSVQEILELSSGSIIELDKLAGEPVDINVNEKLIAKGEVVVIDENFGVRVTDIVSPRDRIKKLN
ncbi:flagellar motor switch phosphatase FliY [Sediminibacillus halophilus]|uniref:Flagellar motor switch protein FliN/FliY n=1 Tax=Sediminibacillus halophilus TaxID=482461 RepID=A0A1G9MJN8_9BACI|nr:flagellar motor switch phosphatase FliY [Sediminibacillus halophilus]SDL73855.1 flagellar motor switch protein FliN/FliY [Sediminibacillus halophilus]